MRRSIAIVAARLLPAAIAVTALAGPSVKSDPARQEGSWDRYRILTERNVFRRDRRVYREPTTRPSQSYTYDSDSTVVLTGIARSDGQFVAFFEDTRTGAVSRVGLGEDVGKGRAVAISLDHVKYDHGGKVSRVPIGLSLAGTERPVLVRGSSPTPALASTQPVGEPSSRPAGPVGPITITVPARTPGQPTGADVDDILERMRLRREQELNR